MTDYSAIAKTLTDSLQLSVAPIVDGHFGTQNSERFVDHNIWGFRLSRRRSRAVSENVCGDAVRAASPA